MKPDSGLSRQKPRGARPARRTDSPRDRVVWAVARQAERMPDLDMTPLNTDGLPARDAAFAHAIYDAVLRRWLTLECVLNAHLRQPLKGMKPGSQGVLLVGVAQMLLLDKVPVHAAINESVEWAKVHLSGNLAGMVNGVLRNVWRSVLTQTEDGKSHVPVRRNVYQGSGLEVPMTDGSSRVLRSSILPEDAHERLCAMVSCPPVLYARWRAQLGDAVAMVQAKHLLTIPPTVLNVQHADGAIPERLLALSQPHQSRGARVWHGPRADLSEVLAAHSRVWVQDSSSSGCVASLAGMAPALRGKVVIDLCAGQGTKTRQLAAVFPESQIIASDTDTARLERLRAATAGLAHVRVVTAPEAAAMKDSAGLVLLDVPCSNSGVLARRVEARYRWSEEQLARLVALQREVLTLGVSLVAPGGCVVYSTCSIEAEENEQQVEWAKSLGLTVERQDRTMPAGLPGESDTCYRDGAFCAVLRR